MNELLFSGYVLFISISNLIALRFGKEALIALMCVQAVIANFFVTKQITLLGFTATASDALAVGTSIALNLLQEYYQKPSAQKAIWISFFCALFYTVASLFHIGYTPAPTDQTALYFQELLAPMPRIVIASLSTYVIVQHLDALIYGILKERFHTNYFIARNYASLSITQLIDTLLFSFLGLYKINSSFSSMNTMIDIIVVSYTIKLCVIGIAIPTIRLFKNTFRSA